MGTETALHAPPSQILSSTSIIRRRPLECLIWTIFLIFYMHYINLRPTLTSTPPKSIALDAIPPKVWQIFFNHNPIDPYTASMQSWITENQDYQYTLVSSVGANAFALKHYANRPEILYPFLSLREPVLRAYILRYMLLESEGGIYSDLDTAALKPVREWAPPKLRSKVRAVVGIEYDEGGEEGGKKSGTEGPRLHFCQRTMAASRGHPLMARVTTDVVEALQVLATKKKTTIDQLSLSDDEMVQLSGPVIWTRAVLKTLSQGTRTEVSWQNFTGLKEPRVFGDVLVLPVNGFGTEQLRASSVREESKDTLVRHGRKKGEKSVQSN